MLVRLSLDDPDPAARAFLQARGPVWAPRFWVLASDGDVVTDEFGPMLPAMLRQGGVQPGTESDSPTVTRIRLVLEHARTREESDRALLRSTAHAGATADDLSARASVLERRGRTREALEAWRRAADLAPGPRYRERLAALLARTGDLGRAEVEYTRLGRDPSDPARALRARARAILLHHRLGPDPLAPAPPSTEADAVGDLEEVLRAAAATQDAEGAAGLASLGLAQAWLRRGDPARGVEQMVRAAAVAEAVAESAQDLLWASRLAMALSLPREALDWLETLLARHPWSVEADTARHGTLDALRVHVGSLEAHPSRPAEPGR